MEPQYIVTRKFLGLPQGTLLYCENNVVFNKDLDFSIRVTLLDERFIKPYGQHENAFKLNTPISFTTNSEYINEILNNSNFNKRQLSKLFGFSRQNLYQYLGKNKNPSIDHIAKCIEKYGYKITITISKS